MIDRLALQQRRAVQIKQHFKCWQQVLAGQRPAGLDRNRSLHVGIDDIVQVQNIAKNDPHHLADIGVGKIQGDAAVFRRDGRGPGLVHETPGALVNYWLQRFRLVAGAAQGGVDRTALPGLR